MQHKTTEELVSNVKKCYAEYDSGTMERLWQRLHAVYGEVMEHEGGNDFKTPHSGIRKRQSAGLEEDRSANMEAYRNIEALIERDENTEES